MILVYRLWKAQSIMLNIIEQSTSISVDFEVLNCFHPNAGGLKNVYGDLSSLSRLTKRDVVIVRTGTNDAGCDKISLYKL